MKLKLNEMNRISRDINSNKEKHPYGYGICGFFSTKERFKEFEKSYLNKYVDVGEYWKFYPIDKEILFRGNRFYKIKVDKNIDRDMFLQYILPCCMNCIEIEWI